MFRVSSILKHHCKVGRIKPENTALFLCDIQEVFRPTIHKFDEITHNSNRIYELAKILEMPIVVTEQYPKAFGHIVPEFKDVEKYVVCEKTMFSMWTPEVQEKMKSEFPQVENVLLVGIETQACIMATCFDLLENHYNVHLLANAISSRSQTDRLGGLRRCEKVGAYLTTGESALFQLLGDARHPKFREASKLIQKPFVDADIDTIF